MFFALNLILLSSCVLGSFLVRICLVSLSYRKCRVTRRFICCFAFQEEEFHIFCVELLVQGQAVAHSFTAQYYDVSLSLNMTSSTNSKVPLAWLATNYSKCNLDKYNHIYGIYSFCCMVLNNKNFNTWV